MWDQVIYVDYLGYDWSKTATCIAENVTIPFKHAYRRLNLLTRCGVISDVIIIILMIILIVDNPDIKLK